MVAPGNDALVTVKFDVRAADSRENGAGPRRVGWAARSIGSEFDQCVGGELKLRTLRAIVVGRRTI
jgi:hypothetical protein